MSTDISVTGDAIFSPIIDHFTLPGYRYAGWLEAGREGLSLPGGKMLVSAAANEGTPGDAGCITKHAYALGTGRIFLQWRVQSPRVDTPTVGAQWGVVSSRPAAEPFGEPLIWKLWISTEAAAGGAPIPLWHIAVRKDGEWEENRFCVAACDGCFDADLTLEPERILLRVNGEEKASIGHDPYPSAFRLKWGSAQTMANGDDVTTVYHRIYLNNIPIPRKHEDLPDGPEDVRPGDDIFRSWIYQGTPEQPRATVGDILPLGDGRLYLTYSHYYTEEAWDESPSLIRGTLSADGGRSWGEPKDLVGGNGVKALCSSLIHGMNGDLLMSFSTEGPASIARFAERVGQNVRVDPEMDRAHHWICRSRDQGASWGEFVCITANDPYGPGWDAYSTGGRTLRLRSGRILQPCVGSKDRLVFCYYSDDDGYSWQRGQFSPKPDFSSADEDARAFGLLEPCVVELRNGSLMMFTRTLTGAQYVCRSSDMGPTWSQPVPEPALPSASQPAMVRSVPSTGDLIIVWNRCSIMERSPLNSAVSRNDGETWENVKRVEQHRGYACVYPSMRIDGDTVMLLHMHHPQYANLRRFEAMAGYVDVRFGSIPLEWFYRKSTDQNGTKDSTLASCLAQH